MLLNEIFKNQIFFQIHRGLDNDEYGIYVEEPVNASPLQFYESVEQSPHEAKK